MAATARWLETVAEKQEAEGVASLLLHKLKQGLATEEEKALYQRTIEDLAVYDWGTESYQNYVPNQWAAAEERRLAKKRSQRGVIAPAPGKKLPGRKQAPVAESEEAAVGFDELPPLTRRPGKFATG